MHVGSAVRIWWWAYARESLIAKRWLTWQTSVDERENLPAAALLYQEKIGDKGTLVMLAKEACLMVTSVP